MSATIRVKFLQAVHLGKKDYTRGEHSVPVEDTKTTSFAKFAKAGLLQEVQVAKAVTPELSDQAKQMLAQSAQRAKALTAPPVDAAPPTPDASPSSQGQAAGSAGEAAASLQSAQLSPAGHAGDAGIDGVTPAEEISEEDRKLLAELEAEEAEGKVPPVDAEKGKQKPDAGKPKQGSRK